jgi:oligosaccharyl transferase complex subunit OST4
LPISLLNTSAAHPKAIHLSTLHTRRAVTFTMITDNQLYSLAIFLGSAAMLLIVLYHFLEVNSDDHKVEEKPKIAAGKVKA